MLQKWALFWVLLGNLTTLIIANSYYSIIAPGVLIANRKYPVAVTLHEATEPATIRINITGPSLMASQELSLDPYESKKLEFEIFKLSGNPYKLTAEGLSGFIFKNETELLVRSTAGPKIYIQTDRAVYKPGDLVNFRVVILNEHTKPVKAHEPIDIEILDGLRNRVKQFKDITLVKGVYTGKFQIPQYPVLGYWLIKVYIGGKYDYFQQKSIAIINYILPKFSVYIKGDRSFIPEDRIIRAMVYGKYTFDKYVEGNVTARLISSPNGKVLQEKTLSITNIGEVEFRFDNPSDLDNIWSLRLEVELEEMFTGLVEKDTFDIDVQKQRFNIVVNIDDIIYRDGIPYIMKVQVRHWNDTPISEDHMTPITMKHGSKEYSAYLNSKGEALFEFGYEHSANHEFFYKDSKYKYPNIYVEKKMANGNETEYYCKLLLKGESPRLGRDLEIEVSSSKDIPYLVYTIMGHSDIVQLEYIKVPPNQKTYTLIVTPTIEMIPRAIIYVHYIQDGHLRYDEMILSFPRDFENQISIVAPKEVLPGAEVTIEVRAQRKAYVCLMAVDLSVFLLDSSYDLYRQEIFSDLENDQSYLPFPAKVYPGLLSGVITLTNANYAFEIAKEYFKQMEPITNFWNFRKKFPETWIFQNLEITDANTQLTLNIPDTITTWRLTAFTIHDITGFGMVTGPTDIIAIKPFFININLPYSVKRDEIISIPITVFNYHPEDMEAEIIMYNEEKEFYFLESNIVAGWKGSEVEQRIQRLQVPKNAIAKVVYWILPKQVGVINLKVTAENPLSTDALLQKLRVEPEGVSQLENKAMYISVSPGETYRATITIDFPLNMVPDSEYVTLSVGGDILSPTLENLNDLVQLPTGSGEQNMVNFVPNILVLNYLKATQRFSTEKELVAKAKSFMEMGYQQQLSYRHYNGGYSVFGEAKDEEPSTWLTAYTIRFFIKAQDYLPIEDSIIESGLQYLSEKQTEDGDFLFTGYLFQPARQNRFGLTAFILMTFLENKKYATKFESTIQKGLDFLNNNKVRAKDIYAPSIMVNALQKVKHPNALKILEKLHEKQMKKPRLRWWSQNDEHREKDVEITAYILAAQLVETARVDVTDDMFILNWLIKQRNAHGGFHSTHDTVVGLQALVKYSEKYNNLKNVSMQVLYTAKDNDSKILERNELTVDGHNALVLQTEELPKTTHSVDIEVTGTGFSLIQLAYRYNLLESNNFKHFQIQLQPKLLNPKEMSLEICLTYQPSDGGHDEILETNMIIMEVNFPSGFITSDIKANGLVKTDIVQKVELKNSDTTLVIYLERLSLGIQQCLDVLADKIHDVMMHKPAAVLVYDYYNINRSDTAFYNL